MGSNPCRRLSLLGCVSGWQLEPLKEKGVMNGLVHDE